MRGRWDFMCAIVERYGLGHDPKREVEVDRGRVVAESWDRVLMILDLAPRFVLTIYIKSSNKDNALLSRFQPHSLFPSIKKPSCPAEALRQQPRQASKTTREMR